MRIETAELTNWTRYRGTHRVSFTAGVHAVTAKHVDNGERSNWLGKSSFMWAVGPFALYGAKMAAHRYEDDWITHGEKTGVVIVEYSNGLSVKRSRERGSSTKLEVSWQGVKSIGKRAQEVIEDVVRMTREDFLSAFYFEQKMMAALILAGSSKLHEKARAWFELTKLQEALEDAKAERKKLQADEAKFAARIEAGDNLAAAVDVTTDDVTQLEEKHRDAHAAAVNVQKQLDEVSDWIVRADNAREYDETIAKAKKLKKQIADMQPKRLQARREALEEAAVAARDVYVKARDDHEERKALAGGNFDGECPVMCEACPAAASVNDVLKSNNTLIARAKKKADAARKALDVETTKQGALAREITEYKKLVREFKRLKEDATMRRPDAEYIAEHGEPDDDIETLRVKCQEAWSAEGVARAQLTAANEAVELAATEAKKRADVLTKLDEIRSQISLRTKAMAVFKRAQRTIAETAIADIEADANALLSEAGIDLAIVVMWERPIKGLTAYCDKCGHGYGASQRAKVCPVCEAPRPPKRKEELDITPTDRSGAADDLGGIAFQLGVASWLRRKRQSPWSVAFIDEPFSACDPHNKVALATQLNALLNSRFGFEQAFITAHDRSVLDALPERFEITATATGSSF